MAQLAKQADAKTITRLDEIAQREAVSSNFLVQILNDLRRGGVIESRRGKAGGYLLARPPEAINLREIVDAVEPDLLNITTHTEGESGNAVRQIWQAVSERTRAQLEGIDLKQLTERGNEPMYYI